MKQFEYSVNSVEHSDFVGYSANEVLDQMGKEGWELIQVYQHPHLRDSFSLVFKREKEIR